MLRSDKKLFEIDGYDKNNTNRISGTRQTVTFENIKNSAVNKAPLYYDTYPNNLHNNQGKILLSNTDEVTIKNNFIFNDGYSENASLIFNLYNIVGQKLNEQVELNSSWNSQKIRVDKKSLDIKQQYSNTANDNLHIVESGVGNYLVMNPLNQVVILLKQEAVVMFQTIQYLELIQINFLLVDGHWTYDLNDYRDFSYSNHTSSSPKPYLIQQADNNPKALHRILL